MVIAGAAETAYSRRPRRPTADLLASAVRLAVRDAGLELGDVDGLGVTSFSLAPDHALDLAWRLGLRTSWLMEDTSGGAASINLLQHAVRAIESGDAEVVVLVAGDSFGSSEQFGQLVTEYNSATRDHLAPLPTGGPNALFALVTARHMEQYGLRREHYGQIVLAQRAWAQRNPGAVYRRPLTMDEYLRAPLVADPLTVLDCVPVVSGANAVVVTADGRSPRAPRVAVRSLVASFNADGQEGEGLETGLRAVADRLWSRADFGPPDVDVVSAYDDYPVMVLIQLADLGFVPEGDLAEFVDRRLASRRLPLNTSGGQLSAGQAGAGGGMHGLVEAVRQLRGEARERQVENAARAVVTGYGGVVYRYGAAANAVALARDA